MKVKKKYNVIIGNINSRKIEGMDVLPYLEDAYNRRCHKEDRPKTKEEFIDFVDRYSMYQYWSRCEYEIIIQQWPNTEDEVKWSAYEQIKLNIELVTECLMYNLGIND